MRENLKHWLSVDLGPPLTAEQRAKQDQEWEAIKDEALKEYLNEVKEESLEDLLSPVYSSEIADGGEQSEEITWNREDEKAK